MNLSEDEKMIYRILSRTMLKPVSEIIPYVPFGKSKTTKLLKEMEQKGVIDIQGRGRGTKYIIRKILIINAQKISRKYLRLIFCAFMIHLQFIQFQL